MKQFRLLMPARDSLRRSLNKWKSRYHFLLRHNAKQMEYCFLLSADATKSFIKLLRSMRTKFKSALARSCGLFCSKCVDNGLPRGYHLRTECSYQVKANSSTLRLPGITLWPGNHITRTLYCPASSCKISATSLHSSRVQYLCTCVSVALCTPINAWLSECIAISAVLYSL